MMVEDLEKIRKDAVTGIKEKANKNPKYLNPANKERQEDMKRLKFANGYEFTCWMQQNEIMKNPFDVERVARRKTIDNAGCKTQKEYKDKCARNAGFKDNAEKVREWNYETGRKLPKEFDEDSPIYFGDFAESLMIQTFEDSVRMPPNNPGFDWKCKSGDNIDNKGVCLTYDRDWSGWKFNIRCNNIADYFILSAWDNRESLNPLYVWIFHKNDIVRGRKFCEFDGFTVTNDQKYLKELEKYEFVNRLEKLKELLSKRLQTQKEYIRDSYNPKVDMS